jgi:hypothetical protein
MLAKIIQQNEAIIMALTALTGTLANSLQSLVAVNTQDSASLAALTNAVVGGSGGVPTVSTLTPADQASLDAAVATATANSNQLASLAASVGISPPPAGAPVFAAGISPATFSVSKPAPITIATTPTPATPGTKLAITTGALPVGLTFTDNGDGTATINGNPSAATIGKNDTVITATNSAGSSVLPLVLNIVA